MDTIYDFIGLATPIDQEVTWEKYRLADVPGFDNWIYITESNNDGTKLKGSFQGAFVFDSTSHSSGRKLYNPSAPDTLYYSNGRFDAEFD